MKRAEATELDLLKMVSLIYKFYENIVFTYDNRPEDNLLGDLLEEGLIDEKEAVCLGLFGLRKVPEAEGGR